METSDMKMAVLLGELDELGPVVTDLIARLLSKVSVGEWTGLVTRVAAEAAALRTEERQWLGEFLLAISPAEPTSSEVEHATTHRAGRPCAGWSRNHAD